MMLLATGILLGLCYVILSSQALFLSDRCLFRRDTIYHHHLVTSSYRTALSSTSTPSLPDTCDEITFRKTLEVVMMSKTASLQALQTAVEKLFDYDYYMTRKNWFKLLEICMKRKHALLAVKVVSKMLSRNIACNSHHITMVLSLACASAYYDESVALIDEVIASGLEVTVHNFSPLLKICGSHTRACEIFRRMEFVGDVPNVISYTTAIKSCEQSGDYHSALNLLELMKAHLITPNERTYCCVISTASRGLAGNIAYNVLREMLKSGCQPNELCYGSTLTACARSGMWTEVELLLDEMPSMGLGLSESVLMSVINLKGALQGSGEKNGDATDLLWRRALWLINKWGDKADFPTESLFTMAMEVCESASRYEEVVQIYDKMLQLQVPPSKSAYSYVLRACLATRNAEAAFSILVKADDERLATATMHNAVVMICNVARRHDLVVLYLLDQIRKSKNSRRFDRGDGSNPFSSRLPTSATRQYVTDALIALTMNFTTVYAQQQQQLQSMTDLLCAVVHSKEMYFSSDAYPMAAKLLLDRGDSHALRQMLNTTLYIGNVNYKRVYDFAMLNLVGKLSSDAGEAEIGTIADFITDIHAARKDREAADLLVGALEQLRKTAGGRRCMNKLHSQATVPFAAVNRGGGGLVDGGVEQRLRNAGALLEDAA